MKIIVIDHEPFTKNKSSNYYIESFINRGYMIEYWDVRKCFNYSRNVNYNVEINESIINKQIQNKPELIKLLKNMDSQNTLLFVDIYFNIDTLYFFKEINNLLIKWCRFAYYHNPTNVLNPNSTFKENFIKLFNYGRLKNKIKNSILRKYQYLYKPNILFKTGSLAVDSSIKEVSIDFFDVVEFKKSKDILPLLNYTNGYFVFLDIMLHNHPDFQRSKMATINEKVYLEKINLFFDKLEDKFKIPVIIAAHPKSNYRDEFKHRIIVKNETMNLVQNSKAVLTHGSLSISFALLFNKSLLYIYSNDFLNSSVLKFYYKRMLNAVNELGSQMINIDDFEIDGIDFDYNPELYAQFLRKVYLKESDKDENFDIISSEIEKLFTK